MLIYEYNYINNGDITPLNSVYNKNKKDINDWYFFEYPKYRFLNFYDELKISKFRDLFIKFYRYKNFVENNYFLEIIKIMNRRGYLAKYRIYLLKIFKLYYLNEYNNYSKNDLRRVNFYDHFNSFLWIYNFNYIFNIIFFFKISFNRIDKKAKKFNRKNKLKYKIQTNYIPQFKRTRFIIFLFIKQLKLMTNETYIKKFFNLLKWNLKKPKSTYFFKFRVYTYTYILKYKYKNTLLLSR